MSFPTTHWSLVAKASLDGDSQSQRALEELCGRYWTPVFRFILARGTAEAEAKDLTQSFFLHVFACATLSRADRLRGRFRSFLLGALVRYLGDQADRKHSLKRGGRAEHITLEAASAVLIDQNSNGATGEFDREWALAIMERSLRRLRDEYTNSRGAGAFAVLKKFLPGLEDPPSYDQAAARMGASVAAFRTELHRLRQRFRALIREELWQTISAPHELEDEWRHLQRVLMDPGSDFSPKH